MRRNDSVCLDIDGEVVGMVEEQDAGMGWRRCAKGSYIPAGNSDVLVENVKIQGLEIAVNEVSALSTNNPDKMTNGTVRTAQVDVVGGVYQYEVNVDGDNNFVGNPISNAQLLVAKHLQCIDAESRSNSACMREEVKYQGSCQRTELPGGGPAGDKWRGGSQGDPSALATQLNTIRQTTLDWAAEGGPFDSTDIICGGDNMYHVNKGAFGIRFDGGQRLTLRNVDIDSIRNTGKLVSKTCGKTDVHIHPMAHSPAWYTGTDSVGISIASSLRVQFDAVHVRRIYSASGNAYGVSLLLEADEILGNVAVGKLEIGYGASSVGISANRADTYRIGTRPRVADGCCQSEREKEKKQETEICSSTAVCLPVATPIFIDENACLLSEMTMGYGDDGSMMMMGDMDDDADDYDTTCHLVANLEQLGIPLPQLAPLSAADRRPGFCGPASSSNTVSTDDDTGGKITAGIVVFVLVLVAVIGAVAYQTQKLKTASALRKTGPSATFRTSTENLEHDDTPQQRDAPPIGTVTSAIISSSSDGYLDVNASSA